MRPIASVVIVVALTAAGGCSLGGFDTSYQRVPQNEGANADVGGGLKVRNVFLLNGTDPASPAPQQALYAVLVNDGRQPDRLERVTVDGGGSVQLSGPIAVPPGQAAGTGGTAIGTVTGVRGATVPMTFVFGDAGPVRLNVPVKFRTGQYATLSPAPAGSPTPAAPSPASPAPAGTPSPSPSPS
jgi:hypothetical protein